MVTPITSPGDASPRSRYESGRLALCSQEGHRTEPGGKRDTGGNSNWRGPIWFPINYLLIEVLDRFHRYYGNELLVEFPTGSGHKVTLQKVS